MVWRRSTGTCARAVLPTGRYHHQVVLGLGVVGKMYSSEERCQGGNRPHEKKRKFAESSFLRINHFVHVQDKVIWELEVGELFVQ